ncbi:MAG: hypothetical protein KIH02_08090 [Parabacteroides sp.]|nr:hypothetical protein [Parabacteroides sp.]
MKQNKVATNLAQDFTDTEKQQARDNIGASQIKYDNSITDMTVTKEIIRPYMNTKYSTTIGSDNFLLLPSIFNDGMVVKKNGSLQTQSLPQEVPTDGLDGQILTWNNNTYAWADSVLKITTYSASFGNGWNTMREIDSAISSGAYIKDTTLSSPVQLSAGKKYLISPIGLMGNIEQTKTASVTSNVSYSLRIWLMDSSKSIIADRTAVIIGEAEIANHNVAAIGEYPPVNGVYHGSFSPTDVIITPTEDLNLDTLRISNGGNIGFGFSSSNPAILVYDVRINGINVMEIQ